ncbi:sialate O-acetylesterase [Chryseobacterium sp. SC28]|uniref:sialate O-acetylesterase n=1 Tax=Chryseobacterium sp. SC28 TaxID=2268028 RepID=UPI000F64B383|nr:sialate O-acetylesterase [Chryseobacterium sp. SC28]RRQ47230.1 sialate O-acetylesterase [Chryseobacterium sp. SC28]
MKSFLKLSFLIITGFAFANIHLPAIFDDNMVLQRNAEVTIWGHADPAETITLNADFLDKEYSATAKSDATFKITFNTPAEGGPYIISLVGYNKVVLQNVMLGEVWLMSGQSNMEMSAAWGIKDGDSEMANANYPYIRLFTVGKSAADCPQTDIIGNWNICSTETAKNFSAVGYFFAQKLHSELVGVPVGVICSAWGGSAAEIWTPKYIFDQQPDLAESFKTIQSSKNEYCPSNISVVYNAMIAPFNDFKIAGAAWYQGETNTANPNSYEKLLTSLIGSWRQNRAYKFPFYIIQIASFKGFGDATAQIKNIQRKVSQNVENSGLVVISDYSMIDDIHPKEKKPVGIRLANLVLKDVYHKDLPAGFPTWKSLEFKGNKAILTLDFADGLHFKNKTSDQFEIAGSDKNFVKAKAKIIGNQIILEAKSVKDPALVRYNWSNDAFPDLFNKAGLPASVYSNETIK